MRRAGFMVLMMGLPVEAEPLENYARGVLEEARGGSGERWFEKALEEDPDAWPLVARMASRKRTEGDIEAASTLYREFATAHPMRLDAQIAYADFLRDVSPDDDFAAKLAGDTLESALERQPGSLDLIRRLFRSYEQRGMRDKSLALFDQVSAGEGAGAALAAAEMARTIFPGDDEGSRAKVDEVFERAMVRTPGDPMLARAASEHFRKSGRLSRSGEMLERHVRERPSSLDLRVRLGVLMLSQEKYEDGEEMLLEVLEIDSRRALAHQSLAKLYRKQELPAKARPHAAALLKIRGGDAGDFVELGDEFLVEGLPREARLLLEKGIFEYPEDGEIALRLAIASRRDVATRQKAARLFREAEALSGKDGPANDPEFLREFAECLLESGQTPAAEQRLRAAIKGYSPEEKLETAAALRRLAEIWHSENRNAAAARSLLKRADSLDPPE